MQIRMAKESDLPGMLAIYERARKFMRETGNPDQWKDTEPRPEVVLEGIRGQKAFLAVADETEARDMKAKDAKEEILGVFYFAIEDDATYRQIFDGAWKNEEPYGVIHRVASAGKAKGFAESCFAWCERQCLASGCRNLRIDTHRDNRVMQHVLEKNGFVFCGKIFLKDGAMRLAYQKELAKR